MRYLMIAAGVFGGDFFLKKYVDTHITETEEREIFNGNVVVKKYYNKGAALNFMEKSPKALKAFNIGIMLVLGIIWYLLLRNKKNPGALIGVSFILGGGANNLYDRITRGHVVDYFSFRTPWKRLNRIVFNISDMFIFLGSILAVAYGERS